MRLTLERVSDSTPEERLAMLRFHRRVQLQQLTQTDGWIEIWEQRAAEHARRRPPPPPPDWCVQYGMGGRAVRPAMVHTSECWVPGASMEAVSRAQAIEALTRGGVRPASCAGRRGNSASWTDVASPTRHPKRCQLGADSFIPRERRLPRLPPV
ncbi:DUF6233 domain-containing protein [Streptomyces niveus]|uniref:DUF6233 domain-containing protein n=1 Tax=Streptomyces niveus TaxID=193462 RepID=UPI00343EA4B1